MRETLEKAGAMLLLLLAWINGMIMLGVVSLLILMGGVTVSLPWALAIGISFFALGYGGSLQVMVWASETLDKVDEIRRGGHAPITRDPSHEEAGE